MTRKKNENIRAARQAIIALGLPKAQQNERSALSLLALLNLTPGEAWADAENPLVGITPIMDWAREHYGREYAPNTRETCRRQTMHQFCDAGITLYNPDQPDRPVNSPKAVDGRSSILRRNRVPAAQRRGTDLRNRVPSRHHARLASTPWPRARCHVERIASS